MSADTFAAMIAGIEARGVSRPEIIRQTGLSKNTIWRLAVGHAPDPKYQTIQKVQELHDKLGDLNVKTREL